MRKQGQNPKRGQIEVAAIIPARGGKQSIPYKNLQKLGGKTLLQWAIEVAFEAQMVDVVMVSTEDARIAKEAEKHGAIVIPRPKKYSKPTSGDAGFYHHAVTWMEKEQGWRPELLVNLRPTGPLRFAGDVDAMVRYMKKTKADGLKSVIPAPLHPYKMWQMEGKNHLTSPRLRGAEKAKGKSNLNAATARQTRAGTGGKLVPVFDNEYRQEKGPDQPRQIIQKQFPVFFQDAQIDITRRKFILRPECLACDNVWGPNMHGYILDERTSVDLDTPEDFRRAAKVYRELKKRR